MVLDTRVQALYAPSNKLLRDRRSLVCPYL